MSRTAVTLNALLIWGSLTAFHSPATAATTTRVASGLGRPIFVTAPAGDPRLFILEQRGVIKVLKDGQVLGTPFLDIDALVPGISGNDERGLLGLAFDPEYGGNGRFYLNYTDLSGNTVIARYHVSSNPDQADPDSAQTVLYINQPFSNHNGGHLAFGQDGYLYIGMGDGGGSGDQGNRAQNPMELLGKMLRIDVRGDSAGYSIPPGNPFRGVPGYREEIWALGMRNPYRWCFDRQTADLWIADVGQSAWEEIDFQPAGGAGGENYGWRLMEGTHCYNPPSNCDDGDPVLTYPIHEYGHGEGCSVTGGYVYRGAAIPQLRGAYFFADFCTARIWSLRYDGQTVSDFTDRTTELAPGGGLTIGSIAGFGEDGFGEVYIVDRGTGTNGEVYKIVPSPSGNPDLPARVTGALEIRSGGPNPFSASTQFQIVSRLPGLPQVHVLDPAGRNVRDLAPGQAEGGGYPVRWDGKDREGRDLPSGTYFVKAVQSGTASVSRVTLVR